MSWVDQILDEYGRGIGLDRLVFNEQGVASLQFEDIGSLFIERLDDAVLLYLVQEIERPTAEIYGRALELCHWDQNYPFVVNAALRGEKYLAFSTRLSETEFSLPTMERIIALFDQLHQQVKESVTA